MNQQKEENDRRNHFMINLHESMGPDRDQLATPGSAVRHASVARHVTNCATRPGILINEWSEIFDSNWALKPQRKREMRFARQVLSEIFKAKLNRE